MCIVYTNQRLLTGILFCLLLSVLSGMTAQAQITRYVSATGITPAASATSWATSTTSLQEAIDYVAANGGGQVWVAAGVYKPTTTGDPDVSFSMRNGVAIYGGFAGNESTLQARPDMNPVTGHPGSSTLSGDINNDGLPNGNTYCLFYHPEGLNLNSTAILDGFFITGGNANGSSSKDAGGAFHNRAGNNPAIVNCVLANNRSSWQGGAVYNTGGSPSLVSCLVQNNSAQEQGGAFCNDANSSLKLTGCVIENNSARSYGGAFYNHNSSLTLINCSLRNNTSDKGGVFYSDAGSLTLTGCTLENNRAGADGGVFYNYRINPVLTNCTLQGNQAGLTGGVAFEYGSNSNLTDCTLKGNSARNGGVFGTFNGSPVLTNCLLENNQATRDGGVLNAEGSSNFVLTNCILLNNSTSGMGGAFYCNEGNPVLKDCLFQNNTANQGGVIYNGGNIRLTDCRLQSNTANEGGAFYCDSSTPKLTNCIVSDNTAQNGGAFYLYINSNANLINCALQNNRASSQGGAVYNYSSSPNLVNCSLQGNTAPEGGAFYNDDSKPRMINCVLWSNGGNKAVANLSGSNLTITYSLFEPSLAAIADVHVSGPGNLTTTVSPFISTASAALQATSPAIDHGNSTTYIAAGGPQTDVAGNPRVVGTSCQLDMGAAEFQQSGPGINTSVKITSQPPSASVVCAGSAIAVAVSVTGTATYQWYQSGPSGVPAPIVSQTAATLSLMNVQPTDQDSYWVVVTGGCNSATSTSFSLSVNAVPTVSLSATGTQRSCTQPQLTLTATASTTALLWSTGQTTATISVRSPGTYSVTATGANGCSAVSNNLTIGEDFSLPSFRIASATVCPGQSVNLTASVCSGQILWSTGATTAMITLTAGSSTSTLTATCTTGVCSAAVTGQVVVGGIQPPPAQILSFTADESACPVKLMGKGIATSFTMTGPNGYVFSTVFREGATHEAIGLNVKQQGNYTLTATYTNSCGTGTPVTRPVAVSRSCP